MSDDLSDKACASTPAKTLEQHITDVNIPKNEAEWWAQRRITELETQLAEAREACREAGNQFAVYADLHAAKGTPDADDKAKRNREWADRLFSISERTDDDR